MNKSKTKKFKLFLHFHSSHPNSFIYDSTFWGEQEVFVFPKVYTYVRSSLNQRSRSIELYSQARS